MNDLTEFQQRAAALAVVKMLNGKHFSVSDLDAVAKTIGREAQMAGKDYAALRGLHCVDWADMGPDLARMTRRFALGALDELAELVQHRALDEDARRRRAGLPGVLDARVDEERQRGVDVGVGEHDLR